VRSGAKILQPVILLDLPGKGLCGKEASFADLIFCSFHQGKEQSLSAAIERDDVASWDTCKSIARTRMIAMK
jgi:hypothetical protein